MSVIVVTLRVEDKASPAIARAARTCARAFLGRLTPAPPYRTDRELVAEALRHVGPDAKLRERALAAARTLGCAP